ncbi:hypothetical protein [Sphingomonas oligophenolica]|uniref:Uncharacterized protein n=1 Tax=Sphingomonas oligophenolica TaxID=301154 RepID=A0A502CIL0_9SPHN|nr:hypothetical protein [Sphingomonas oligophenolica]TPG13017.1 hypothetical protein EAH84_06230 [Sphingomonas oligophenolica]
MHPATIDTGALGRSPIGPFRRTFAASGQRRSLAHLVAPVLLLLLPIFFFVAFFHPATLQIGNAGWLLAGDYNSDNGENALGPTRIGTTGRRAHR